MINTENTKDVSTKLDSKDIRLLLLFVGFFVAFILGVFYGMFGI